MTEPVTAADVIADAVDTATNCFLSRKHLRDTTDDVVAALREACGGGDIVISRSGSLATLTDICVCSPEPKPEQAHSPACRWQRNARVVPVERGA